MFGAEFDQNSGAFGWFGGECDDTVGQINDAIGCLAHKSLGKCPKAKNMEGIKEVLWRP